MKTADELAADGWRLAEAGNLVVILYPSQEAWAVEAQLPFLRSQRIPRDTDGAAK